MSGARRAVADRLAGLGRVAVAVSGGVDSMTLATLAHRTPGVAAAMFHAVSAAVPPAATARVRRHAAAEGWALRVLDAGELADPDYLRNPVERCFHCKTHLYDALAARTDAVLVSGTNTDDLADFRPGLRAAAAHGVRHPYVEAGVAKAAVRAIARELGLADVAELPAAPCLASRVETGIAIRPRLLVLVDRSEDALRALLAPSAVRCRVRAGGLVVELDEPTLAALDGPLRAAVTERVAGIWAAAGEPRSVAIAPYRRGSAVS